MNGRTCYIRQKCQTHRQVKRGRDTKVPQSHGPLKKVGDEAVHKELGDKMERVATTASSLEAELESDQFWQTIALSTIEDGVMGITAPIDRKVKVLVSKASIRRHLKLEDVDGIRTLPTAEIFEQLALIGVHSLGRDEGSLSLNELTDLCTSLPKKVESLESELKQTKQTYHAALIKLIKRVKKLEQTIKISQARKRKKVTTNKARRRARIVISEDEDAEEDSSNQGRKISKIDKDPIISLVHPEQDMEYDFDVNTAEGFTTASIPVTTTSASVSTVSPLRVSTAKDISGAETLVYIRRSAEKRKDKGKAIIKEDESVQKKAKKQLEKERAGFEEAIRLQEQINEEEKQRIAREAEIAKQLLEEFDRARQEQEVVAKADQAHDIDWSDLVVLRYHALQNRSFSKAEVRKNMCIYLKNQGGYKLSHFKGMSYEDIRPIFKRVWDQNNAFVPKDSEIEKEVMKIHGFDFQQKSSKKRSREDSDEDNAKKQKLKDDAEKEELRDSMDVVLRDDIAIDIESLATK
ncbi:hypothetical protein Tco_0370029, partial [Tanacetum coccineum]